MSCFCGCGERPVARHHCVYQQALRHVMADGRSTRMALAVSERAELLRLTIDPRNLVAVAFECHGNHHSRSRPYELAVLPDSVFEFAAEVLGPGRAFNYLEARYAGEDPRLAVLLAEAASAA